MYLPVGGFGLGNEDFFFFFFGLLLLETDGVIVELGIGLLLARFKNASL